MNRIIGTGSGCPGAAGIRQLAALVKQITGTGSGCPGTAALRQLVALVNRITGTGSGCPGAAGIRQLAALVKQITGTGSGCPGAAGIRQLAALVNRITGTGSGLSRNSSAPAAGRSGEPDHRHWLGFGDLNRSIDLFDLLGRNVLARMSEILRWRLCDYTAWTKKGLDGSI